MWEWDGRGQQAGPATSLGECVLGRKGRAESRAEPLQLRPLQRRLERWGGGSPRPGAGAALGPSPRPAARHIEWSWRLWLENGDLG